ncbi:hypothetical protein F2Q70_00026651 [Brassica cretica]|uniref:Uncharacterized protein n=1 Tax=Brassica cretica TaxID=69181 RepID=A0A8S9L8T0_BRACR|nr:hypothetical protein F2Q70_00026651 [Brassica cretica]
MVSIGEDCYWKARAVEPHHPKPVAKETEEGEEDKTLTKAEAKKWVQEDLMVLSVLQGSLDIVQLSECCKPRIKNEVEHVQAETINSHVAQPPAAKYVNSMVLFDQETNNKLQSEAPMFKLINQSLLFCWCFHEAKVTGVVRRRNREFTESQLLSEIEKRLAPQNITLNVIHRCDTTLHI